MALMHIWFTFFVYIGFLLCTGISAGRIFHILYVSIVSIRSYRNFSLVNAPPPFANLYLLYNFAAEIMLIAIVVVSVKSELLVRRLLVVFLVLSGFNSVQVIVQGILLHKRQFGFGGIMFVDYVGISVVVATVLAVFHSGLKRYAFIGLAILFGARSL